MNNNLHDPTKRILDTVAKRITEISNRQSLITLTRGIWSKDKKNLTILVSVLPDSATDTAIEFLTRNKNELRGALFEEMKLVRIPYLSFANDEGEENRQAVDEALL